MADELEEYVEGDENLEFREGDGEEEEEAIEIAGAGASNSSVWSMQGKEKNEMVWRIDDTSMNHIHSVFNCVIFFEQVYKMIKHFGGMVESG